MAPLRALAEQSANPLARLHALASGSEDSGRPRDADSLARLQALGRLLFGLVLVLAACGGSSPSSPNGTRSPPAPPRAR